MIISLDTLRADQLGCYGYDKNTSPNIDRFAAESTVFPNSFANANWTLPSHMSLMTSLYPADHRVTDKTQKLSQRIPVLAEVLRDAGFRTAGFTAGYFVDRRFGFDRGFDVYEQEYDAKRENDGQGWRLEHLEPALFSWLEANRDKRFFVFVHSYDTHEPFIAHEHLESFDPGYEGKLQIIHDVATFKASPEYSRFRGSEREHFNINQFYSEVINAGLIDLDDADRDHVVALYDNEIHHVDKSFADLRKKLEELDLLERTVVVLWSDHGEELLERGLIVHGGPRLHDELLHVPLVIRIPGRKPVVNPALAQGIDIAPTVLDILGVPQDRSFAGIPLFDGESENAFVVAEVPNGACVRTKQFKLVVLRSGRVVELYDLERDPSELRDVAEEHPEIVAELFAVMKNALNEAVIDEELQRKLESLGYVDEDS